MDAEMLRRACERAGMGVVEIEGHWYVRLPFADLSPEIKEHREWIESRCADILTGMVRERGGMSGIDMETILLESHPDQILIEATPEQRITAARRALTPAP